MRSSTKRVISLLFIVFLLFAISISALFYLNFRHNSLEQGLTRASVDIATSVVDLRHGTNNFSSVESKDSKYLSTSISSSFHKYLVSLESLNSAKVNISSLYKTKYSGVNKVEGGVENTPVVGYSGSSSISSSSTSSVQNDKRIFYQNGVAYVYVKDLNFGSTGNDIIPYKGVNIVVSKSSVPQTYTMMKHNPDDIYKFDTYVLGQDSTGHYIAVVFDSVLTSKQLVVRVYNNGKTITHFEVE